MLTIVADIFASKSQCCSLQPTALYSRLQKRDATRVQTLRGLILWFVKKFFVSDMPIGFLVQVKSSRDFGVTWGAMQVIRSESGPNLPKTGVHCICNHSICKHHIPSDWECGTSTAVYGKIYR